MNAEDLKVGDSVRDNAGRPGVVASVNAAGLGHFAELGLEGRVCVVWEDGARTWIFPGLLSPINSRSTSPQADRGQTAGTSTPQDVPAQMELAHFSETEASELAVLMARATATLGNINLSFSSIQAHGNTSGFEDINGDAEDLIDVGCDLERLMAQIIGERGEK